VNETVHIPVTIDQQANIDDTTLQAMETKYGARSHQHNLQPRKPRDYGHMHVILESIVMTQHSFKNGLKKFGDAGFQAILKELQQLHDRKVMEPKGLEEITGQQ
jgi:hypothetical protein